MEKHQCSVRVFGDRGFHWQCERKAIIERDGKLYCKIHDPEYVKAKNIKLQAKWDAVWKKKQERWHRESVLYSIFTGIDTATIEKSVNIYKATPDMYEALKTLQSRGWEYGLVTNQGKALIKQALAKAERVS